MPAPPYTKPLRLLAAATAGWSLASALPAEPEPDRVTVAAFSAGSLAGWEEERFTESTEYRLQAGPHGGPTALRARTQGAASGLYREIRIDLQRTPWLHWSWRVDDVYSGLDETRKEGDDYPARIYVVVSGGLRFWNTRALNYVWSSSQPVGTHWANAFTANAQLLAVESGPEHLGQWRRYRRNLRDDWKLLFGEAIDEIDAIALMSDSDNGGQAATAWYGDIWFGAD
jgi:hypothetical protein